MNKIFSGGFCLRFAFILIGFFGLVVSASAQNAEIRFPEPPVAGQPVILEMYYSSCDALFDGDLYDILVTGNNIQAQVNVSYPSTGVCLPGPSGWQAFHLPPLQAGAYNLVIDGLPVFAGSSTPIGPPAQYATTVFNVAAAPPPLVSAQQIPSLSGWSALLLIVASTFIGRAALRLRA